MNTLEARLREAESRAHIAENFLTALTVLDEAGIAGDDPRVGRMFNEMVRLPDGQAMRRHVLREAASAPSDAARKGSYTPAARKLLAQEGKARPDGSYPISTAKDVQDAVADFNRSSGTSEDKAHIIKQAKAVPGGTENLPADWSSSARLQESVKRLEQLGIPTLDGDTGPVRLREACSTADLARFGVPVLDDSHQAPQLQHSAARSSALEGIPMLAEAPGR